MRNWRVAATESIFARPVCPQTGDPVPNIRLVFDATATYATALHRDGLGTVRAVTQFTTVAANHGKKTERTVFRPFGQPAFPTDFVGATVANDSKGIRGTVAADAAA